MVDGRNPEMSPCVLSGVTLPLYACRPVDRPEGDFQLQSGGDVRRLYEADAVDQYVEQLHIQMQELRAQLDDALRLAREAESRVSSTEAAEALIGRTLLTAQRAADDKTAEAEQKARGIIAAAQRQADDLLAGVRLEAEQIIADAHETIDAVFQSLRERRRRDDATLQGPTDLTAGGDALRPPVDLPLAASREPASEVSAPPTPRPASRDDDSDDSGGGRIVDLPRFERWSRAQDLAVSVVGPHTPARPNPVRADASPPASRMTFAATGTEGVVLLTPLDDDPLPDLALQPPAPIALTAPVVDNRAPLAELRERWRVARSGPDALDDDLLSRAGHLDSLADGTYVDLLRDDPVAPCVSEPRVPSRPRRRWWQRGRHAR